MTVSNTRMEPERRKGPDFWVKALGWLSGFSWVLMLLGLFIVERAKPQSENLLAKAAKIEVNTNWDQGLIKYLFYLVIFGLCTSIIGIMINSRRYRREEDRFKLTLVVLGMLSIFGIIIYLFTVFIPNSM